MPSYIVTCKKDATPEQVDQAKQYARDQGGQIGYEYTLIKGFQYGPHEPLGTGFEIADAKAYRVTFPEDSVHTLDSHEHVEAVEKDQEVRTQ
ncbi:hypothetical protein C7999DRAFT_31636 [Corynascus novoguineensis]|uniref:Inhibitor I9 domain-containing protein n=1 Tax=Corynascus novoguineensis TaxID=1126955 RepID=A0AAN7HPD9_9PEZI|nr:hypothetical protein C7999DRAFT_31636 [Corynascus novoguineensis]